MQRLFSAILALCVIASACLRASAEDATPSSPSYIVDVWDTEKGLPQNEVTAILQTQDGYLWCGTPNGLARFDGFRFSVFDEGNTPGLTSSRIVSLFEDRRGDLWIGSDTGGITVLRNGRARPFSLQTDSRPASIASACQDGKGALWFYSSRGHLWQVEANRTNLFLSSSERASDYHGVVAERSGQVWVGTGWRVFAVSTNAALTPPDLPIAQTASGAKMEFSFGKLDLLLASRRGGCWVLADGRVRRYRPGETEPELEWAFYPWLTNLDRVSAACEDLEGNLIVGTARSGIYWYNATGVATGISTNQGLSNNYILSLHMDREGNLWVGTDGGGLNRVKRPAFQVVEGSRGKVVQSAASDPAGALWLACNGYPLISWNGQSSRSYRLSARTLLIDRQHRLWAGTLGAGLWLEEQQEDLHPVPGNRDWAVSALHEDPQGRLWVGTDRGLGRLDGQEWTFYTSKQGLSEDTVQAIASDREGTIWVATRSGGLNRLKSGQISAIHKSDGGLPSDRLWSLWVDTNQVLWVGTDGAGLGRLENGRWTRFTRADGLVSNSIGYILEDGQGYFWLGSNAGLMRVSRESLNAFARGATNLIPCRVYGRADGLPSGECSVGSQPAACQDSQGKLYFPTIQGLVSADPAALKANLLPPPVIIESVQINGQMVEPSPAPDNGGRTISLRASKERLEIQFTSLNLSAPERARFKYWLEGHETGWTEAGQSRVASYSSLAPGQYQFHVTACNEDGVWNPTGASLAITVLPPFWRTWWFMATSSLCLLGIVAGLVHYVSTQKLQRQLALAKQRETVERERTRIARDIHDQLGANLTQVALLGELVESDKDAPAEVEQHARQISLTARDTTRVLDEIVWAVNPSNDTLDGLVTYICKYAQEYLAVAGLHCRMEFPQRLPNISILPEIRHNVFLACKESITNVVRHARATEVRLQLTLQANTFTLLIQDNGKGPDESHAKLQSRNGLRNMRQRMESVGGEFEFGPAPGGGTLVCLTAPLGNQPNGEQSTTS